MPFCKHQHDWPYLPSVVLPASLFSLLIPILFSLRLILFCSQARSAHVFVPLKYWPVSHHREHCFVSTGPWTSQNIPAQFLLGGAKQRRVLHQDECLWLDEGIHHSALKGHSWKWGKVGRKPDQSDWDQDRQAAQTKWMTAKKQQPAYLERLIQGMDTSLYDHPKSCLGIVWDF